LRRILASPPEVENVDVKAVNDQRLNPLDLHEFLQNLVLKVIDARSYSKTLTFATTVGAGAESIETQTVAGIKSGDLVIVNYKTAEAGLVLKNVYASADNTLTFIWYNYTGGGILPSATTYNLMAVGV
jgi:hypothetical protein